MVEASESGFPRPLLFGFVTMDMDNKYPSEFGERRHDRGSPKAAYEIDWSKLKNDVEPDVNTVVDFVIGQYRIRKAQRAAWEKAAAERLAWVRGQQTVLWHDGSLTDMVQKSLSGDAEPEKLFEQRQPVQINMLKRFVMSWIGLLVAKPLTWNVVPSTRDHDDVEAAKLASDLLGYYWSSGIVHGTSRLLDALWHMYATGIIWIYPHWDPKLDRTEHFSDATDQTGSLVGDVVYDFATGFELTEPLGCRSVAQAGWIIDSRLRSIEWGLERYGDVFKDVAPDADSHPEMCTYGLPADDLTTPDGTAVPEDRVLVHTLWRPKSQMVKKGFHAVVADDKLVHMGDHPYTHGRLPFIPLQEQPDYELFRPGGGVRDLMGLQAARNRDRSQRFAHRDSTISPVVISEKGVLPPDAFTTNGPRVITVKTGGLQQVKQFPPASLPADIAQLDEVNRRDMEDVAGIHRSTMGRPEGTSQSGRHAMLMTQGDVRGNVVSRLLNEAALGKAGQQALWLIHQHVDTKRAVTIAGANSESRIRKFKGSDLVSKEQPYGPYEFNVQVRIGIEPDMEAVMARIDGLTERGWLRPNSPEDRQTVFTWLGDEYAGVRDPEETHRSNARTENDDLMGGDFVPASPGDHHAVHIREHMEVRTTGPYKKRLPDDPGVTAKGEGLEGRLDRHIQEHYRHMARQRYEPMMIAVEERMAVMAEHPQAAEFMARQAQAQAEQGQKKAPARGTASGSGSPSKQAPQRPPA